MVSVLVARDPNQDLDSIPNLDLGVWSVVRYIMSLYNNLLQLKDKLKNKPEERPKLNRVMSILMRRYDYGIEVSEDRMEQYRYGDFKDDIAAVKR